MSYNFCNDCGGRADYYGSFEILRDYGFVEAFPQRWIFHDDLGFDIDEVRGMDGSVSGVEVKWFHGEPNEQNLHFLGVHLRRLKDLEETHLKSIDENVPKNEFSVITQFHQALIVAITHACPICASNL